MGITTIHTQKSVSGAVWHIYPPNPEMEQMLAQQYGVSVPVASFLANRFCHNADISDTDLQDIEQFLYPKIRNMPDPYIMADMEKLVGIAGDSIKNNETIAIFGDYDVDGATSITLMVKYFQSLGTNVLWHVPERKDGYGPNIQAFEDLTTQGADLIICVDCGTTAFDVLQNAHHKNMRVCIIDHHIAQPNLPKSLAVVNPNRCDDASGLGMLCAVGVCFCVLVALNRHLRTTGFFNEIQEPDLKQWLGLVAIGTVCDVVPLQGLNRVFVSQGLKNLNNNSKNNTLNAIKQVANISGDMGVYELGWVIGPYLNACGRMGQAKLAVQFLLEINPTIQGTMAVTMRDYNTERQQLVSDAVLQAHQMIKDTKNSCDYGGFICVKGDWSDGIIGIVAGRLKDHYNKPAIVFSTQSTPYKASARSVQNVDVGNTFIYAVNRAILHSGGGHKMAAGCSVQPENYDSFIAYLQTQWTQPSYDKIYTADMCISPLVLHTDMVNSMQKLEPYGTGNPEPLYILQNVIITSYKVLKESHIRFSVRTAIGSKNISVIAFGVVGTDIGDCIRDSANTDSVSLLGKVRINEWNGQKSVQFLLQDIAV